MRRMVVSTARGEFVTEKDVAEQQLAQELVDCYRLLPDAGIYLDGHLVPEEARRAALAALSEGPAVAAARAAAAPPESTRVAEPPPGPTRVAAPTLEPARAAATPPGPTQVAAPPLEPEKLKEYGQVLAQLFDDMRKGYVQSMNELNDIFRRYREMCLDTERRFADEVAQQRALTHKSLADVDLLGRSVKATQIMNAFGAEVRPRAIQQSGPTLRDYVAGLVRTVAGDKQK